MRTKLLALLSLGAAGLAPAVKAQEIPLTRIDIDVAQEKAEVAPTMYGIFFEDINRSADGGIYAELIFNRGFEEANLPSGCTYNPNDKRVYAPPQIGLLLTRTSAELEHSVEHRGYTSRLDDRMSGRRQIFGSHRRHRPSGRRGFEGYVPEHRPSCGSVPPGEQRVLRAGRQGGRKIRPAFLYQGCAGYKGA